MITLERRSHSILQSARRLIMPSREELFQSGPYLVSMRLEGTGELVRRWRSGRDARV